MREAIVKALNFLRIRGNIIEMRPPLSVADDDSMEKLLDEMLGLQNEDGGWPREGRSSFEATADVLQIVPPHRSDGRMRKGVEFLLNRQRGNGGWAEAITALASGSGRLIRPSREKPSRIWTRKSVTRLTANVAMALCKTGWAGEAVRRAKDYPMASQLEEGGGYPMSSTTRAR